MYYGINYNLKINQKLITHFCLENILNYVMNYVEEK